MIFDISPRLNLQALTRQAECDSTRDARATSMTLQLTPETNLLLRIVANRARGQANGEIALCRKRDIKKQRRASISGGEGRFARQSDHRKDEFRVYPSSSDVL